MICSIRILNVSNFIIFIIYFDGEYRVVIIISHLDLITVLVIALDEIVVIF